jgi:uncharacterized protein YcgI (DUF1989 family)
MDCIVAFSACPQDIAKIQGQDDNTPKDAKSKCTLGGLEWGA